MNNIHIIQKKIYHKSQIFLNTRIIFQQIIRNVVWKAWRISQIKDIQMELFLNNKIRNSKLSKQMGLANATVCQKIKLT